MEKQFDQRILRAQRKPESGNAHRLTQIDTKKYQTGKRQAKVEYMVSSSRN